jgi:hypothetical protein
MGQQTRLRSPSVQEHSELSEKAIDERVRVACVMGGKSWGKALQRGSLVGGECFDHELSVPRREEEGA